MFSFFDLWRSCARKFVFTNLNLWLLMFKLHHLNCRRFLYYCSLKKIKISTRRNFVHKQSSAAHTWVAISNPCLPISNCVATQLTRSVVSPELSKLSQQQQNKRSPCENEDWIHGKRGILLTFTCVLHTEIPTFSERFHIGESLPVFFPLFGSFPSR